MTCYEATLFEFACVDHFDPKKRDDSCKYWETGLNSSYFTFAILYKKSAWNNCTGVCFGFVKIADSVMTQLILSNEYLCVIFTLFGEKKFLFKQNICMLFKCSIDTETAHQLLSNYSQMTSCIEFINLSPEPIQNNFNITLRILQNMYLFLIEVLVRVSPQN